MLKKVMLQISNVLRLMLKNKAGRKKERKEKW